MEQKLKAIIQQVNTFHLKYPKDQKKIWDAIKVIKENPDKICAVVSQNYSNIKRLDLAMKGYTDHEKRLSSLETIVQRAILAKPCKKPKRKPFDLRKFVIKLLEK